MFQPYDNFGELEKEWGIPRKEWTSDQWEAAAKFCNQSAELLQEIAEFQKQSIEHLEQLLDKAYEQLPQPKKRGRPRTRFVNALWRAKPTGRPRTITRRDELELVQIVARRQAQLLREGAGARRVTAKEAITTLLVDAGVPARRRKSEISRLQKLHSRAKSRIAKPLQ